jgi:hypothetical protein
MDHTQLERDMLAAMEESNLNHYSDIKRRAREKVARLAGYDRLDHHTQQQCVEMYTMGILLGDWLRTRGVDLPSVRSLMVVVSVFVRAGREGWLQYILPLATRLAGVAQRQFYGVEETSDPYVLEFISHIYAALPAAPQTAQQPALPWPEPVA